MAARSRARRHGVSLSGALGAAATRWHAARSAVPRPVRRLPSRLPHLHLARVRQSHRHIPPSRRARPHRPQGDGRGECERVRPLSVSRRGTAAARLRIRRARLARDTACSPASMSETEERDFIAASIERVSRASGKPCAGWIGQDYAELERTPFLLAEAGLTLSRRLAERRSSLSDGRRPHRLVAEPVRMGRRAAHVAPACSVGAFCRDRRRGCGRIVRRSRAQQIRPFHRACICIHGCPECRTAFRTLRARSRRLRRRRASGPRPPRRSRKPPRCNFAQLPPKTAPWTSRFTISPSRKRRP